MGKSAISAYKMKRTQVSNREKKQKEEDPGLKSIPEDSGINIYVLRLGRHPDKDA